MSRVWLDADDDLGRPLTRREKALIALLPILFVIGCVGEVVLDHALR